MEFALAARFRDRKPSLPLASPGLFSPLGSLAALRGRRTPRECRDWRSISFGQISRFRHLEAHTSGGDPNTVLNAFGVFNSVGTVNRHS
jgi:hypothetical protein